MASFTDDNHWHCLNCGRCCEPWCYYCSIDCELAYPYYSRFEKYPDPLCGEWPRPDDALLQLKQSLLAKSDAQIFGGT
jgi:hypothetical protein